MTLRQALHVLMGVALFAVFGGCEDEVTAPESDYSFSLYGVLLPEADTQWVRVFPVEGRLEPTRPEPMEDVRFTSTDQATGAVQVWRDSLFQGADGQYTHVFWAPFRPQYGHTYRLNVQDAATRQASASVDVPPRSEPHLREPVLTSTASERWAPVTIPVYLADAPRLMHPEVSYRLQYGPDSTTRIRQTFSYDEWHEAVDDGREIGINLHWAYEWIRDRMTSTEPQLWNSSYGVKLLDMTLRVRVVNAEWEPPEEGFDPLLIMQPGTMTNVEGGFGFVGAGYRLEKTWVPDPDVLEMTPFRNPDTNEADP